MDDAIVQVGDKSWYLRALNQPQCYRSESDCMASIESLRAGACRPLSNVKSTVAVLLDAHISISECGGSASIARTVADSNFAGLPQSIRFRNPLPSGAKVDIVLYNLGDGTMDVLKVMYFEKPVARQLASGISSGNAQVPVFRPGPWAVKKGLQHLLNQLKGHHTRWHIPQRMLACGHCSNLPSHWHHVAEATWSMLFSETRFPSPFTESTSVHPGFCARTIAFSRYVT